MRYRATVKVAVMEDVFVEADDFQKAATAAEKRAPFVFIEANSARAVKAEFIDWDDIEVDSVMKE